MTNGSTAASFGTAPLGIRLGAGLDQRQLHTLRVLETYDLTPIRERLFRSPTLPPDTVDEAIFEFRRYLGLRAIVPEPITMVSPDVDEVWHTCLLFTRLYMDLCNRVFGEYLHHDPATEVNLDRRGIWSAFERVYRDLYGEPSSLWQMWQPLESVTYASCQDVKERSSHGTMFG